MRAFCRFWLVLSLGVSFLVSPWISQPANAATIVNCSTGGSITIANNAVAPPAVVNEYGDIQECSGSVTIPAGVLSIPNFVFKDLDVTTVNIPASVTSIENAAFAGTTSLLNINVTEPNSTYTSSSGILFNNDRTYLIAYPSKKRVETYTVPVSVEEIGDYAFDNAQFLNIVIPTNVINIEVGTFKTSSNLETITVTEPNAAYTSIDGVLFDDMNFFLIAYPNGVSANSYEIPEWVTGIEDFAFYGQNNLYYLSIPSTVTFIGNYAFFEADNIRSVTFGSDSELGYIYEGAFEGARYLSSMDIPNSVKIIESRAFKGTDLPSIVIPVGIESIGIDAFYSMTDLESITVDEPNSNYTSLDGVLFDDSMSTLITYPLAKGRSYYTIPAGVTSISTNAFSSMKYNYFSPSETTRLQFLTIASSVTSIDNEAFARNDYLEEVNFEPESGLITIAARAFYDSGVNAIDIPSSVKSIGDEAFGMYERAGSEASITFESGSQLETIGAGAFKKMWISTFTIPASVKSIGSYAFAQADLDHCENRYTSEDTENIIFESGSQLETIGVGAFYCKRTPTFTIPASVTSIGSYAFSGNYELKSFRFQSGSQLETIGSHAFQNVSNVAITIPSKVTSIGDEAFSFMNCLWEDDCGKTSVVFASGTKLSTIGNRVFAYTEMRTFTIPASVTSIGSEAFMNTELSSLKFESGSKLTSIGNSAFWGTSFGPIIIPAGVKSMGSEIYGSLGGYLPDSIYFLGNAPSVKGNLIDPIMGSKAYVKSASTGFSKIGKLWKGLTVTAMPTTAIVKPSVSGAAKVSQTLVAKSGEWIGYTTPKLSYQWYSCTAQVKSVTGTIPKTCKTISKATKSTLAVTKNSKGKYLAVLVTGKGTGTTAIKWLSKSTTKVN